MTLFKKWKAGNLLAFGVIYNIWYLFRRAISYLIFIQFKYVSSLAWGLLDLIKGFCCRLITLDVVLKCSVCLFAFIKRYWNSPDMAGEQNINRLKTPRKHVSHHVFLNMRQIVWDIFQTIQFSICYYFYYIYLNWYCFWHWFYYILTMQLSFYVFSLKSIKKIKLNT